MSNYISFIPDNIGRSFERYLGTGSTTPEVKHIVVDLETFGVRPNSLIISLGAVALDADYEPIGYFYSPVGYKSFPEGYAVDIATLDWWIHQDAEATAGLDLNNHAMFDITVVFYSFVHWVQKSVSWQDICFWGNGSEFDLVILNHALSRAVGTYHIPYHRQMSLRSIWLLWNKLGIEDGIKPRVKHHALYDAEAEALNLRRFMKIVGDLAYVFTTGAPA